MANPNSLSRRLQRLGCGSRRQRGIALVVVLWITILLAAIAVGMSQDSRTQTLLTRNQLALVKARAFADGAIERAMYEHLRPPFSEKVWFPNGAVHGWEEDGAKLAVSLAYESGRINLNNRREPPLLLKGLFTSAAGLGTEEAGRLADAILDWLDQDDAKRLNGAEAPEYRAAGRNYVPANANFETIEEVQRVLGMTPEIYAKIADLITVHSGQPGIDPMGASRGALLSIPNMTPEIVDSYIQRRELARAINQPPPSLLLSAPFAAPFLSLAVGAFHVNATVRMPDGEIFVRDAVVQPTGDPQRPLQYLSWREGVPLGYPDVTPGSQSSMPGLPPMSKP